MQSYAANDPARQALAWEFERRNQLSRRRAQSRHYGIMSRRNFLGISAAMAATASSSPTPAQQLVLESSTSYVIRLSGNGTSDDTAGIQQALNASATSNPWRLKMVELPPGDFRITQSLVLPNRVVGIKGNSKYGSRIICDGVTGGCFTVAPGLNSLRPFISDLSIQGDNTSGPGLDLTAVEGDTYDGYIKNLSIQVGGPAIKSYSMFSMDVSDVLAGSFNSHSLVMGFGPGVTLRNVYATIAGPNCGGFRMVGMIAMDGCNGVNQADYWGIFGNEPLGTYGFGDDFPFRDYPQPLIRNTNVEAWGTGGGANTASAIYFCQGIRSFYMDGKATAYPDATFHSFCRQPTGSNGSVAVARFHLGAFDIGAANPPTSGYHMWCGDNNAAFADLNGVLKLNGVTTYRNSSGAQPMISGWGTIVR